MKHIAFSVLLLSPSIPAAAQISVRISQDLSGTYRSQGEVPATGTPRSLDDLGGTWRRYSAGLFFTSIHATRRYRENAESQSQVNRLIDIETVIARYGVSLGVSF